MDTRLRLVVSAAALLALILGPTGLAEGAEKSGAPRGWHDLFSGEDWYKQTDGKEQVFTGKLEAVPDAGGISTLQRASYYRLGGRTIYTGARKIDALDRLVGRNVEVRGKPVDMELEGRSLKEIWPAAVRAGNGGAAEPVPAQKPAEPGPVAVPRPGLGERPRPGPGAGPREAAQWNESEIVFVGKLERADAGPVAQSFPPIYSHTLHFTVEKVLRGKLEVGAAATCSHSARQVQAPTFPVGQSCLVAAGSAQGRLVAVLVEKATKERLAEVETACALPLGWKLVGGKPVSPWAALGAKAWPRGAGPQSDVACSVTGRPALLCGNRIALEVEHVPPAKEIQWTNPDGDGEYKITVRNTTDGPVEVPALLSSGDTVLWAASLVILCQGRAYPCPGFQPDADATGPTKLGPGQSVSTVVNVLRLEGPEWPRGGYRIAFQFCLGELGQTKSFYYMSRHHDAVRKGLTGK